MHLPTRKLEAVFRYWNAAFCILAPDSEKYCSLLALRGKLVDENPETAAKITRAIMKGTDWVAKNPEEAAKIIVEKKYISGNVASNAALLKQYNFTSSVEGGRESLIEVVKALKQQGILEKDTDMDALVKKAYAPVTDKYKKETLPCGES